MSQCPNSLVSLIKKCASYFIQTYNNPLSGNLPFISQSVESSKQLFTKCEKCFYDSRLPSTCYRPKLTLTLASLYYSQYISVERSLLFMAAVNCHFTCLFTEARRVICLKFKIHINDTYTLMTAIKIFMSFNKQQSNI